MFSSKTVNDLTETIIRSHRRLIHVTKRSQLQNKKLFSLWKIYILFAGWEVCMVKNCDRGLENAARDRRPRAAFSKPRSQFFTIRTDP